MERIVDFAKKVLYHNPRGTYVDFTMGNGNDTLFFSRFAPEGRVYAFDIQPAALDSTQKLLEASGVPVSRLDREETAPAAETGFGQPGPPCCPVTLILDSHSHLDRYGLGPIGLMNCSNFLINRFVLLLSGILFCLYMMPDMPISIIQ